VHGLVEVEVGMELLDMGHKMFKWPSRLLIKTALPKKKEKKKYNINRGLTSVIVENLELIRSLLVLKSEKKLSA
jgi:hypothetical protein